jgi:hypothetical protein
VRSRTSLGLIGLLATAVVVMGTGSAAHAAKNGPAATSKCANVVSAQDVARGNAASTAVADAAADATVAQVKAQNDPYTGARPARDAAHDARKLADAKNGNPHACAAVTGGMAANAVTPNATSGSGYAYISWLYHYGQDTSSWCGEATVAEISSTTPGASRLAIPQSEIAGWLGNGRNDGTSVDQMVSALNHYVGVPDFGWNFYSMVWMDDNPTSAQRSAFLADLQIDVDNYNAPVSGNAYEVVGGPHLVGHPNQLIFHHFAIGGWNTNTAKVWYTDSATTVWSSVPAYSWYSTNTVETILGGRGYVW